MVLLGVVNDVFAVDCLRKDFSLIVVEYLLYGFVPSFSVVSGDPEDRAILPVNDRYTVEITILVMAFNMKFAIRVVGFVVSRGLSPPILQFFANLLIVVPGFPSSNPRCPRWR